MSRVRYACRWGVFALLCLVWLPTLAMAASPSTEQTSTAGEGQLPDGVTVTTAVSRLKPVQRAVFMVTLTVVDRSRNVISIGLHRPHGDAIDARRIDISQDKVTVDGRLANRRVYRWAVSALQPGAVQLAFARMRFSVTGGGGHDFHFTPATRTLAVQPVPAYLPEYLPVAPRLTVHETPLPPLVAGQPVDWHWTVRGRGLTEAGLAKVLAQQLLGSARLHVGKPEIRLAPDQAGKDPLAQTFSVRIPLLPDPQGNAGRRHQAHLAAIRLPYVRTDAAGGGVRLATVTLPARTLSWRPGGLLPGGWQVWLRWLGWVLIGAVLALLLIGAGFDLWRRQRRRLAFRRAQARLRAADDAATLLAVLRAETGCATTGAMAAQAPNPRFIAALTELDAACYGGSAADLAALRDELVRWLPRRFFVSR